MRWTAYFHPKFKAEFDELSPAVQDELLASLVPLREFGPSLGRPEVDTLNDSKYAKMKELRFRADGGVWRVAFAFDPQRNAILLVAGDKAGVSEKKFYKRLIEKADKRYKEHLDNLSGLLTLLGWVALPGKIASVEARTTIKSEAIFPATLRDGADFPGFFVARR